MGFWTPGSSGQFQDQLLQREQPPEADGPWGAEHHRPSQALRHTKNPPQLFQHHTGLPGDAAPAYYICSGLLGRHCRDLHQSLSLALPNCPGLERKETVMAASKPRLPSKYFSDMSSELSHAVVIWCGCWGQASGETQGFTSIKCRCFAPVGVLALHCRKASFTNTAQAPTQMLSFWCWLLILMLTETLH